jgi:Flp pilus assembly protein TadG
VHEPLASARFLAVHRPCGRDRGQRRARRCARVETAFRTVGVTGAETFRGRGNRMARPMTWCCELLRRLTRDQRGAFAVVLAVSIPVVAGILGLGIETGIWYTIKRHDQAIADVAALSGAIEIADGGSCATGWSSCVAAKTDADANNFDVTASANSGSTIVVTTPGGVSTVTVTLQHQQTPLMVSYFLGTTPFTIGTQAVAQVQAIDSCMAGVAKTGTTLHMSGSPSISTPGCEITSDSTSQDSIKTNGSPTIDAYSIVTAGGVNGGCADISGLDVPPSCGATAPVDPYASVAVATSPANLTTFAMPTLPSTATTFPTLPTVPANPSASAPAAPGSQTGTGTCAGTGVTTFSYTKFCYNTTSLITINASGALTAGKVYSFKGPVTIAAGATVTFSNNPISLNGTGGFTINGTATNPTSIYVSNGSITSGSASVITLTSGGSFKASGGFALAGTTTFGPANYGFYGGALALNGTTTLQPGTTTVYVPNGALTTAAASTLTFCGTSVVGSCAGGATSSYALSATSYTFGGTTTFGSSSGSGKGYGLYGGALTINSGTNVGFLAPVNFYLDTGSLTINGCAAFQAGTSTVSVNAGNLIVGSTGNVNFDPGGSVCGVSYTSGTSQYTINTKGSGNGVTLGGAAAFNAGTYYFLNSNSGGAGVAINGGTAGAPITLAAGIYSVQNGNLSIGSAGHASFAAGTPCSPTGSPTPPAGSCIYTNNGNFSNAGVASFATGTYYLYNLGSSGAVTNTGTLTLGSSGTNTFYIDNPNGPFTNSSGTVSIGGGTYYVYDGSGFTSSSTSANALTFTGGSSSNYYFLDPSGSGGTTLDALDIPSNANAAFGPATYYIVNGSLEADSGATLTCPNCAIGGAGVTFVLTGTGTGTTLTNNIGTVQFSSPTTTLNAPATGTYAGLLIFQDRNAGTFSFAGNSSNCKSGNCNTLVDTSNQMDLTGAIYLPTGAVGYQGGKSSGNCLVLLDAETSLSGSAFLTSSGCAAAGVATETTNHVALAE